MIELLERIPKEKDDLRWVFGLTVSVAATKDDIPKVISILQDEESSSSGVLFIRVLAKFSVQISKSDNLSTINALIEKLINEKDTVIQKEASKGKKRLD